MEFINKKKGWKKKISRKQFRHHDIKLFMPATNSTTCLLKQKDAPTNLKKPEPLTKEAITESIVKSLTPTENHARKSFSFPESSDASLTEMNNGAARNGKHNLPPIIVETPVARRRSVDVTTSKPQEAPNREPKSLDMGTFYMSTAPETRLPNAQNPPCSEAPNYHPLSNRQGDYLFTRGTSSSSATRPELPIPPPPPYQKNVFNPDAMTAHYLKLMNGSKNNAESSDIAADYYVKLLYSYMNGEPSFQSFESIAYAYTFVLHICNRVPGQNPIKRNIKKVLNKTVIYIENQLRHLNVSPYAVIDILVNPHRTVEKNNLRNHVDKVLRAHHINLRNAQTSDQPIGQQPTREPPEGRVHALTNGGLYSVYPNTQPPPYPYTSAGPFLAHQRRTNVDVQSSLPDFQSVRAQNMAAPVESIRRQHENHVTQNPTWRPEGHGAAPPPSTVVPEDRCSQESQNGSSTSAMTPPDKDTRHLSLDPSTLNRDDVFEEITQEVVVGNDYTHKLRRVRIGRLPELENQPLPFLTPPMQANFCPPAPEGKHTPRETAVPQHSPQTLHTIVKLKPETIQVTGKKSPAKMTARPEVGLNLTVTAQKNRSDPQTAIPIQVSTDAPETVLNLSKPPQNVRIVKETPQNKIQRDPLPASAPKLGLNLTISSREARSTHDVQTAPVSSDNISRTKTVVESPQTLPTRRKIVRVGNVVPEVIVADESMQITKESVKREPDDEKSENTGDITDMQEVEFLELLKKLRHTIPSSKLRRIILNETGIFQGPIQNEEPIEITDSDDESQCDERKSNVDENGESQLDETDIDKTAAIMDLSKSHETTCEKNEEKKKTQTEELTDKINSSAQLPTKSKDIYSPEVEPISPTDDGESAFIFPEKNPATLPNVQTRVEDAQPPNRKRKQHDCPDSEANKKTQTDTGTVKMERASTPLLLNDLPKGKLCYFRESNTLLRYFEDNQAELFVKNLTEQDDEFIKSLGLDPVRFRDLQRKRVSATRKSETEIVKLPHNVEFSMREDFLEAEDFVKELKLVEEYVPKDFSSFYRFVTGYQIVRNKNPVSLQTFLVMYNTNRTNDLLAKYIRKEQCYTTAPTDNAE
ncbi:uncharacterized protein LOC132699977 isoform X2 [Cylas formicarius]|nr:uncharacterized protein LOC132699977 isoform X2 [Cylas formicarius]